MRVLEYAHFAKTTNETMKMIPQKELKVRVTRLEIFVLTYKIVTI